MMISFSINGSVKWMDCDHWTTWRLRSLLFALKSWAPKVIFNMSTTPVWADPSLSWKQLLVVIMCLSLTRVPPYVNIWLFVVLYNRKWAIHGNWFGIASVPPKILDVDVNFVRPHSVSAAVKYYVNILRNFFFFNLFIIITSWSCCCRRCRYWRYHGPLAIKRVSVMK